ncbi:hypothetical protein TURU_000831 [Turdus rufiventris]|nr:hypothetical protein TURU_001648 [Turdus rufiventris]KAF4805476.1 hypothetical protein TURU_000831 [Turdus rufiventris]
MTYVSYKSLEFNTSNRLTISHFLPFNSYDGENYAEFFIAEGIGHESQCPECVHPNIITVRCTLADSASHWCPKAVPETSPKSGHED